MTEQDMLGWRHSVPFSGLPRVEGGRRTTTSGVTACAQEQLAGLCEETREAHLCPLVAGERCHVFGAGRRRPPPPRPPLFASGAKLSLSIMEALEFVGGSYLASISLSALRLAIGPLKERGRSDRHALLTETRMRCGAVLQPQVEAMPHHWSKMRVEEMLCAAQLPFTILQPSAYMQNLLPDWQTITANGVHSVPYPPETRLSLIDLIDLAAVAALVLTEPGHFGATYELCGTPGLTQTQLAESLSRQLNRPVRTETVSLNDWEKAARARGLNDYAVATLLAMFRYYALHGLSGSPNVLRWLLAREPTTLAAFVQRTQ